MKNKSVFCLSLFMLIAALAVAQDGVVPTQIPCGPIINPNRTLFVNWPQYRFDLAHSGCNTYEQILNRNTVGNLTVKWRNANGYGADSPAIANGIVYMHPINMLVAINASSGTLIWSFGTNDFVGVGSSPAVAGGIVYVGDEYGYLYAIDAATGVLIWKYHTGGGILSSPIAANGVVYFTSDSVYALNASTGTLIWKYAAEGDSSPAVVNGVVYVGSGMNVLALDAGFGAVDWEYTTGSYVESSPAIVNGKVYVGSDDNYIYALNASTGALVWKYLTGNYVVSSPAVADGMVYVASYDGDLYASNASSGALVWSYVTDGPVESSPAVANGVVYIGSSYNGLLALRTLTGAFLWKSSATYSLGSPVVANGVLYNSIYDGNQSALTAFSLPGR